MLLSTGLIICNKSQKSSEKGSWETKTVEIIILKLIENAKYNYIQLVQLDRITNKPPRQVQL